MFVLFTACTTETDSKIRYLY